MRWRRRSTTKARDKTYGLAIAQMNPRSGIGDFDMLRGSSAYIPAHDDIQQDQLCQSPESTLIDFVDWSRGGHLRLLGSRHVRYVRRARATATLEKMDRLGLILFQLGRSERNTKKEEPVQLLHRVKLLGSRPKSGARGSDKTKERGVSN